jgi:hypothetical protein
LHERLRDHLLGARLASADNDNREWDQVLKIAF